MASLFEEHKIKLFMLMNYTSSISIVFLNKLAYEFGFPPITLTLLHFVVTFLGLKGCATMGLFEPKAIRVMDVVPLCAAFCGFVVFTNLSLSYNTVGFYQLAKVMTTPCIVVLQTVCYNKTFSQQIKLSLLPVCLGVALVSKADVTVNMMGSIFAVAGILVTSLYQIWVQTKQKELDVNPFQLLYYQAPLSAAMLAVIVPFFEPISLLNRTWGNDAKAAIMLSAMAAFFVNLSIFLVIGKTSPITYNVLGHFKLCTVLSGGFLIFNDPLNAAQGAGIVLTLSGVFLYTHYKLKEQAAASQATALPTKSAPEPDKPQDGA